MTGTQLEIIQKAQAFVTELLTNKLNKNIRFHTLEHTEEVVTACESIADYFHIADDDKTALLVAAWFHDTGYTGGQAKDHETLSVQLANDFLVNAAASPEMMTKVSGCINATRMPQTPTNTIEKIICDADLFHLGTDAYAAKTKLLRNEMKNFGKEEIGKKDWWQNDIQFLEDHKYFTTYGQERLQPIKEVHIRELKEKLNHSGKKDKKKKKSKKMEDKIKVDDAKLSDKDKKKNQSERGIATVFRIMAQNQNNLSQMADSKANILISVNAIILSIVISSLITKLDTNPNLMIPFFLLVAICVSTIVFSILATRPNVSHGTFTQDDITTKKTNLLFFGNF
nr:DUF5706 domain-containing protein [Chitinophagaceae bacterium]